MSKRFIVLDTETTGLEVEQGHRIIEIGALLLEDRRKTDDHFHVYLNPERLIDEEAQKVHGISNKDLIDKPKFSDIADEFLEFINNSTLIIHNAPFDLGFLNNELNLISSSYPRLEEICEVEDSLVFAREKYPGQRNSLDALAKRFDINNYDRTYHGAMLDTNILADVYFHLTGGQSKFEFSSNFSSEANEEGITDEITKSDIDIPSFKANSSDVSEHKKRLNEIESQNNITTLWNQL